MHASIDLVTIVYLGWGRRRIAVDDRRSGRTRCCRTATLPGGGPAPDGAQVAEEIVRRAPQDLVFVMRFLGESQHRLMRHFQEFIRDEAARRGATAEEYPLLAHFVDAHAAELRDFVFNGVALSRHFRVGEIEFLTRDSEAMLRVDIWDSLKSHIETAERRFLAQATGSAEDAGRPWAWRAWMPVDERSDRPVQASS